jgi:glutamate dehydrogenase/leucine dehydrogenase
MASVEMPVEVRSHARNGKLNHSRVAFEEAAAVLDLEPWIVQRLRHPVEESTAYLQIARDSGEIVCVPLLGVRHSEASGCAMGSLEMASDLQQCDCRVQGMERTWQSALLGLPLTGAAYGLVCDPQEWNERELIAMISPLARRLAQHRGGLVLFPGNGCCREFMGRLAAQLCGTPGVKITGTPDVLGGLDPERFTAEGIAALVSAALRSAGRAAIGARVAIQGFGALGRAVSQRLLREGMRIVALSDTSGGIYRSDGVILEDVVSRLAHDPLLCAYKEAEHLSRADLFCVEADILLLTSGTNEFNESHCKDVAAEIIVEAQFNGINEEARNLLSTRKTVAPFFVVTCGTLVGSYGEVPGSGILRPEDELLKRCYGIVGHAVNQILHSREKEECSFEQAAYRHAVQSAANYLRASGFEH